MSLFCGAKCKCKRRGKSYFSGQPDLQKAFSKACDNDSNLDREKFICSGRYYDERAVMLMYGYDPCPESGATFQQVIDPTNSREEQNEDFQETLPVLAIAAILIAAGLGVLAIIRK